MSLSKELFSKLEKYIDKNYMEKIHIESYKEESSYLLEAQEIQAPRYMKESRKLKDLIEIEEETFAEMLLRLIDQKDITDVYTYKNANVDRRLFSKIRSQEDYKPSKITVISFAISLQLNLDETKDLLLRAGYALSPSDKFDVIVEFFIKEEFYNMYDINEALDQYDQRLLGV